jgi:hypothetical protein
MTIIGINDERKALDAALAAVIKELDKCARAFKKKQRKPHDDRQAPDTL